MESITAEKTVELLQDIESRSRRFAIGLPQQVEVKQFWEGVLFVSSGMHSIAPLNEVKEILNYPSAVTSVPGTKPWILGVANIRGNLLPLIDLQLFLGGTATTIGRRSRVLVIDHQGLYAGLLVGDVKGIRHLTDEQGPPCLYCPIPLGGTYSAPISWRVRSGLCLVWECWRRPRDSGLPLYEDVPVIKRQLIG